MCACAHVLVGLCNIRTTYCIVQFITCSSVVIYTIPRNQNTIPIQQAEKTQMTHCSLSLTLSHPMGRDLPATLSFSNIRTYTQVRTPNSMQEDSWPFFRAPIPSRYHVKKRTALPPETKLLSHVDHPKN